MTCQEPNFTFKKKKTERRTCQQYIYKTDGHKTHDLIKPNSTSNDVNGGL